jgi:4-amino-4-deoxy-L-arabinose transferase-like glycosyltransferase
MLTTTQQTKYQALLCRLLLLSVFVNFLAINTIFFSDDPGLYASIAKQMIYRHQFFPLYSFGQDWLDKPHLPFWLVYISYKIFGIHTWAYKLPALLCFLLSLLYTWLFTKKFYGELTAIMAVLIVSTSLHIIMSNADVRAEPYLMAFIIGAIYHIANLQERFNLSQLVLAALFTALAIMTKGIFVIVPIYGALGGQLLLQKEYREIFRIKWVAMVLLTVVFITPELYALYIQFDAHPEKLVFGKHYVSGIKFFLWDSQFGRFANNGPITRPSGDIFFFIHTLLWAFAPWCLLFYYAAFKSVRGIFKGINQPEYYTLSGGLILLVLFSVSGFQLPFYTNIIFPLFAVITANFCAGILTNKAENTFRSIALWAYIVLFPLVILILHYYLKPESNFYLIIGVLMLIVHLTVMYVQRVTPYIKVFMLSCSAMIFVGLYINTTFYPVIIASMGQVNAANQVNNTVPANQKIYTLKEQTNIFQFYCNRPTEYLEVKNFASVSAKNAVFYADKDALLYITAQHLPFRIIWRGLDYPQERILPAFINKSTRETTLEPVYLLRAQ